VATTSHHPTHAVCRDSLPFAVGGVFTPYLLDPLPDLNAATGVESVAPLALLSRYRARNRESLASCGCDETALMEWHPPPPLPLLLPSPRTACRHGGFVSSHTRVAAGGGVRSRHTTVGS